MLVLLSPSKTMNFTYKGNPLEASTPEFFQQSLFLIRQAKQWSVPDICKLMKVSNNLAQISFDQFQSFSALNTLQNSEQAIFAYNGDAYLGLDAKSLSIKTLNYSHQHLRILSGLYGVLKPFDLIQPHRLEMGLQFKLGDALDLYHFWSEIITQNIENQLNELNTDVIVNLASKEYSKVIDFNKIKARVITPSFYNQRNGKYKMVSFWVKKARGMMTRFIMENKIENPDEIIGFDSGYYYEKTLSKTDKPVFISEF
jgi:hypothetical protein